MIDGLTPPFVIAALAVIATEVALFARHERRRRQRDRRLGRLSPKALDRLNGRRQ
jgi:hypothetical protein